jgi:N-acyl homoserine lactone hydrolase
MENQVMSMRFYVLGLGFMEMDQSWVVMNYKPASVSNPNRPALWTRVPVLSFLIITDKLKVLYDTGCDPLGMSVHWPATVRSLFLYQGSEDERIERRLASLGLACEDIDIVVASHLHYDHAGNIRLFNKAKILVHHKELSYALVTTHVAPQIDLAYSRHDFDIEGLHWELVDEDLEIVPGLEVITLEGHSPGMLGLVVHLEETGTLICPGDAIYSRMNYGPPPRLPGTIYDSLGFHRTIAKVKRLQMKYHAKIFYPHDIGQFEGEMLKSPNFYI